MPEAFAEPLDGRADVRKRSDVTVRHLWITTKEEERGGREKEARHHENVGLKTQLLDILRKAFHQDD